MLDQKSFKLDEQRKDSVLRTILLKNRSSSIIKTKIQNRIHIKASITTIKRWIHQHILKLYKTLNLPVSRHKNLSSSKTELCRLGMFHCTWFICLASCYFQKLYMYLNWSNFTTLWIRSHIDNYACFQAQNKESSELNPSDLAFHVQDNRGGKNPQSSNKKLLHRRLGIESFPASTNVYGITYFNCK